MSAVVAERHIYVYGTADDPSEAALRGRREQAVKAATWSVYRGPFWRRVKVFPRVVADANVRESDFETSNLVLFGTASTNRIIASYSDRLPLQLKEEATDEYGLVYTFPVRGQEVLVSSGLPWWQMAPEAEGGSPFAQQVPALTLTGWPDYRLFRAHADSVIVGGRFNRSWQLTEQARRALERSGVVQVTEQAVRRQP